jgi:thioester reductase-like protein
LIALARDDHTEARRRLEEAIAGWERLVQRTVRADSITAVLADLGRPVVGLITPERELTRAQTELESIAEGDPNAVIP